MPPRCLFQTRGHLRQERRRVVGLGRFRGRRQAQHAQRAEVARLVAARARVFVGDVRAEHDDLAAAVRARMRARGAGAMQCGGGGGGGGGGICVRLRLRVVRRALRVVGRVAITSMLP